VENTKATEIADEIPPDRGAAGRRGGATRSPGGPGAGEHRDRTSEQSPQATIRVIDL